MSTRQYAFETRSFWPAPKRTKGSDTFSLRLSGANHANVSSHCLKSILARWSINDFVRAKLYFAVYCSL